MKIIFAIYNVSVLKAQSNDTKYTGFFITPNEKIDLLIIATNHSISIRLC